MVDFKGEKRSNATHQSTTDPEPRLMRMGNGQPTKLSYGWHMLMENRNGLCVDILVTKSTQAEHRAARQLLTRARRRHIHPRRSAWDERTTRTEGYQIGQRRCVEEILDWLKTVGGLRKTRFIGQANTQTAAFISDAAYNLLRIAKLSVSEVKA